MANYEVQYTFSFDDIKGAQWRGELCLKNGPVTPTPTQLMFSGEPLVFEVKNNDEDKFESILQTELRLQYMYTGATGEPHPETFIVIESDDWLTNIYKNGSIYWRGFLNPDSNSYPWIPTPFAFTMKASDFSFLKGVPINLDDDISFLYDFITIGEFINRTLFYGVGYDDPILNIVYTPKPDIIGVSQITDSLFVHTDAFYDFEKGPMFAWDALAIFLSSIGARMFHSQGAYWLQYISDIGNITAQILQITPLNLSGVLLPSISPIIYMGNGLGDGVVYTGTTQEIIVQRSLKQKEFNYVFKAINQLINFDWRDFTEPETFPGWQVSSTQNVTRVGLGTLADTYKLRIFDRSPGVILPFTAQNITANTGQRLQIQARIVGNFAKDVGVGLMIGPDGGDQIVLTAGGEWIPRLATGVDNISFPISIPNTNIAAVDILSAPIPPVADVSIIRFFLFYPRVVDSGLPVGETLYVDISPVFVRRFNDLYVQVNETVNNDRLFSYVADPQSLFFIDRADDNLSNSLFYDDSGTMRALPLNDWDGRTIDEIATLQQAVQQSGRTYNVMGTFQSNSLTFDQGVLLRDKSLLNTLVVRDKYSVKSAFRDLLVAENKISTADIITRNIQPITKEQL